MQVYSVERVSKMFVSCKQFLYKILFVSDDDLTRVLPHVWFSNYVIGEGMRLQWIYINFTC